MKLKEFLMTCDSRTRVTLIDDECYVIKLERTYDLPTEYNNYKIWHFKADGNLEITIDVTNKE